MGSAQGRGFVSITLIIYLVLGCVIAYMGWTIKSAFDERDTLRAEKKAAQERATALALLWSKSVDDAEEKANARVREAKRGYDSLLARAQSVNRGSGVVVGGDTGKLLNDASRFANSAPAAPEVDPAPADEVPKPAPAPSVVYDEREFATYLVTSAAAYRDAVGQWQACVDYYNDLRNKEQTIEHAP